MEKFQRKRFRSGRRSEAQMPSNCDRVLWDTYRLVGRVGHTSMKISIFLLYFQSYIWRHEECSCKLIILSYVFVDWILQEMRVLLTYCSTLIWGSLRVCSIRSLKSCRSTKALKNCPSYLFCENNLRSHPYTFFSYMNSQDVCGHDTSDKSFANDQFFRVWTLKIINFPILGGCL